MARTRSIRIRESLDELEQLRQYYQGRPQARRILFLAFLKEDPKQTISEAARKADISDRRGRYWWDAYRDEGLQGLLGRRVWKMEEKTDDQLHNAGQLSQSMGLDHGGGVNPNLLLVFFNAVALNSVHLEMNDWLKGIREAMLNLLPDVDYVVINVRTGIDVLHRLRITHALIYRQHLNVDKTTESSSTNSKIHKSPAERLIEEGKHRGFPFKQYHPPKGFDFYLDTGRRGQASEDEYDSYIGTFLLLRLSDQPPIAQETLDLVERLRPFFVYVFSDFVARTSLNKPGAEHFRDALAQVASDVGLTEREIEVLLLEIRGHSYQSISDLLHISLNTV
ncbi:MAG: helix-turn-helix domain-containing protein, partial [Candidatus Kapaibacterium sp.]